MSLRFGVLGHPVAHSLSPVMHTAAFRALCVEATYERFDVAPTELGAFIQRVRDEKIAGLSVTIPHKVTIMEYLDEIAEAAQQIGAVNTIFWRAGKLVGDNTDWCGAMSAIESVTAVSGKSVVVLGGGGSARAVCFGLRQQGAGEIIVLGRDVSKLTFFAEQFGAEVDTLEHLVVHEPNILINTTPLGMQGARVEESPVPMGWFQYRHPVVFDIVYTPRETVLLRDARSVGCQTVEGIQMLVGQGVAQLRIWFAGQADVAARITAATHNLMREAALQELQKK